jgi:hypothetical protein
VVGKRLDISSETAICTQVRENLVDKKERKDDKFREQVRKWIFQEV